MIDDIISNAYGQMSDVEYKTLYELASIPINGYCIEIGALYGKSTSVLALASKTISIGKVISIDIDFDLNRLRYFKANLDEFNLWDYVIPVLSNSAQVSKILGNVKARLLFIDGGHDYDTVSNDLRLYAPLVVIGGCLVFHDYNREYDVNFAVDEYIVNSGNYSNITIEKTLFYATKN